MRLKHAIFRARHTRLFGIDDLIMGTIIGSIGGAAIDAVSAHSANQANIEAANANREFSRNAHQIEVADLEKAGLSPMLSYRGQGASLGGGVLPDVKPVTQNTGAKIVSAMETAANIQVMKTQSAKNSQEANLAQANTALADKDFERKTLENEQLRRQVTGGKTEADIASTVAGTAEKAQNILESKSRMERIDQEILESRSRINLNNFDAELREAQARGQKNTNQLTQANWASLLDMAHSDQLLKKYQATEAALGATAAQAAWRIKMAELGITERQLETLAKLVPNMFWLIK